MGRAWVELCERALAFVEAPNQEEALCLEIPRMRGVRLVTVLFERHRADTLLSSTLAARSTLTRSCTHQIRFGAR